MPTAVNEADEKSANEEIKLLFKRIAKNHKDFLNPKSYTAEKTDKLSERINHTDLMEIYIFMEQLNKIMFIVDENKRKLALEDLVKNPKINEPVEKQKERAKAIEAEFFSIMAGDPDVHVFRFPKEITHLARTVLIVRNPDGELQLNLQTVTKMAEYEPESIHPVTGREVAKKDENMRKNLRRGTYKQAKYSYRIDESLAMSNSQVTLTAKYEKMEELEELKKEVRISRSLNNSNYFVTMSISKPFYDEKKRFWKVLISSPRGTDLLSATYRKIFVDMSASEKKKMIASLLKIGAIFNQQYVHQDIKPGNILLFANGEKGYRVTLSDFGISKPLGDKSQSIKITRGYESPEIAAYKFFYKKGYYDQKRNSFGYLAFYNNTVKEKKLDFTKERAYELRYPDPKNDSWAMGITIFEILYGRKPNIMDIDFINRKQLLRVLLDPIRENRATLAQAYEICTKKIEKKDAVPAPTKRVTFSYQKVATAAAAAATTSAQKTHEQIVIDIFDKIFKKDLNGKYIIPVDPLHPQIRINRALSAAVAGENFSEVSEMFRNYLKKEKKYLSSKQIQQVKMFGLESPMNYRPEYPASKKSAGKKGMQIKSYI